MRTPVVEAAEDEPTDNAAITRTRIEAQATRRIEDAEGVRAALDLLDRAVGQVSRRALPTFAERAGRIYALAMARLGTSERQVVRAAMRREESRS